MAGVENIQDPKAVIRSISHAVYYPNFHPFSGVNDLALIKASIDKHDNFIGFNMILIKI